MGVNGSSNVQQQQQQQWAAHASQRAQQGGPGSTSQSQNSANQMSSRGSTGINNVDGDFRSLQSATNQNFGANSQAAQSLNKDVKPQEQKAEQGKPNKFAEALKQWAAKFASHIPIVGSLVSKLISESGSQSQQQPSGSSQS